MGKRAGAYKAHAIGIGVLGLAIACGSAESDSSNGGSGPGGTPTIPDYEGPSLPTTSGSLPVEELGDAFETILCEALIQCRPSGYRDVAHCKADREPEGVQDVLDGVSEGRIAYDADAMGECRRVFEANLCGIVGGFDGEVSLGWCDPSQPRLGAAARCRSAALAPHGLASMP